MATIITHVVITHANIFIDILLGIPVTSQIIREKQIETLLFFYSYILS